MINKKIHQSHIKKVGYDQLQKDVLDNRNLKKDSYSFKQTLKISPELEVDQLPEQSQPVSYDDERSSIDYSQISSKVSQQPPQVQQSDSSQSLMNQMRLAKKSSSRQDDDSSEEEENVKIEGWLKLRAVQFLDTRRYPLPLAPQEPESHAKIFNSESEDDSSINVSEESEDERTCEEKKQALRDANMLDTYHSKSNIINGQYHEDQSEIPTQESFYFRLAGKYFYFTETQHDMNVLAAIQLCNLRDAVNVDENCFVVTNKENDEWELCTCEGQEPDLKEWKCAIDTVLGRHCEGDRSSDDDNDSDSDSESQEGEEGSDSDSEDVIRVVEERLIQQPVVVLQLPSPFCNENWNYAQNGTDWNCKCSEGLEQSPININTGVSIIQLLENMEEITNGAEFKFPYVDMKDLRWEYKENTLRINCIHDKQKDCQNVVFAELKDYNSVKFKSQEIIIHTPSEHRIDGKQYDMEIQIYFNPVDEDGFLQKSALSILFEAVPGSTNYFFDQLDVMNTANCKHPQMEIVTPNVENQKLSLQYLFMDFKEDLFQQYFSYFKYMGSQTAPPCDEYVHWYVYDTPMKIGWAKCELLKRAHECEKDKYEIVEENCEEKLQLQVTNPHVKAKSLMNSRNVQELGNQDSRKLLHFDCLKAGCCVKKIPQPKTGHYEKLDISKRKYFYVSGSNPSGIPDAFVVTKEEAEQNAPRLDQERDDYKIVERPY